MTGLAHALHRTVVIRAACEVVFGFFTDSARWAAWWGAGSIIDAKPGGAVRICYPGGTEAVGEVLEIEHPRRLVFSYGYTSGESIPAGGSRVTIRLEPHADGTRLHLTHEFADPRVRDAHVQGWRYQLSLFGNVVSNEAHANAAAIVDAWFDVWSIVDESGRAESLSRIAATEVQYRDRFSTIDGAADLLPHIGAALHFMPGLRTERRGGIRHCQGMVLADWIAVAADGEQRGSGTNVFVFGADRRLVSVVGFWN